MSTATTTLTTETTPRPAARAALDQLRAARQDAETQVRTLTQECAALKGRHAALALDTQLGHAGAADERVDVEARLAAAEAQREEQRGLAAEAARREPGAYQVFRTTGLVEAEAMLAEKQAECTALVAQIRMERERTPADVYERVVLVARQVAGSRTTCTGRRTMPVSPAGGLSASSSAPRSRG